MLKNIKVLQQTIFDWVIIGGCTIVTISLRLNLDQLEILKKSYMTPLYLIIVVFPKFDQLTATGMAICVEGLYCKRPIQCLTSSKILTPHPPHCPASVYPPPPTIGAGGGTHSLGGEGVGGQ